MFTKHTILIPMTLLKVLDSYQACSTILFFFLVYGGKCLAGKKGGGELKKFRFEVTSVQLRPSPEMNVKGKSLLYAA